MTSRVAVVWRMLAIGCGLTLAVAWIHGAVQGDDDRSQIIVRSGSLIFENGTPAQPGTPWADEDTFLHEYKPQEPASGPEFKGVKNFEVSFLNAYAPLSQACSQTLTGKQIQIDYTKADGSTVTMKVRLRNHGLFGKSEPKVDPQGATLKRDNAVSPPRLTFEDTGGYISRVSVDKVDCSFSPALDLTRQQGFQVQIQPKADK